MAKILFIISAPSGSGKSSLVSRLRSLVEGLEFSISYTTRQPRGSEKDGVEYHFVTAEVFEELIATDELLEWAKVFGNYYGTARSAFRAATEAGADLLLDIDVQGAMQVMAKMPEAVSVFILPPSPAELERRLRHRSVAEHVVDEAVIARRLSEAGKELERIEEYQYAVVNDRLDEAVDELRAIVLTHRNDSAADKELAASCRANSSTTARSERLVTALASFGVVSAQTVDSSLAVKTS